MQITIIPSSEKLHRPVLAPVCEIYFTRQENIVKCLLGIILILIR